MGTAPAVGRPNDYPVSKFEEEGSQRRFFSLSLADQENYIELLSRGPLFYGLDRLTGRPDFALVFSRRFAFLLNGGFAALLLLSSPPKQFQKFPLPLSAHSPRNRNAGRFSRQVQFPNLSPLASNPSERKLWAGARDAFVFVAGRRHSRFGVGNLLKIK